MKNKDNFVIPHSLFQTGLQIEISGRQYIVRESLYTRVSVCPVYHRDPIEMTDISSISHDDPRISVSMNHWSNRAIAARFLQERQYIPALIYLDGTQLNPDGSDKIKPVYSARIIEEALIRLALEKPRPLGVLMPWKSNNLKIDCASRDIYMEQPWRKEVSVYVNVADSPNALGGSGWMVRWSIGRLPNQYPDAMTSVRHYHGYECGSEGKTRADQALSEDWILL